MRKTKTNCLWAITLLLSFQLTAQTTLFPYQSSWKYLDNGINQGTAWRGAFFDDATWKTGNGLFGYGVDNITTTISFGPNSSNKYITTYFRKAITISNPSQYSAYTANVYREDGIVVYVNGTEVYRNNLASGTVNYNTLASSASDNGEDQQTFTINPSVFVAGNNVIAVEIHQSKANSSDMNFDMRLLATLSPVDATAPTVVSSNRQSPAAQTTNAGTLTYRVTFSEPVTGVDAADFTVTTTGGSASGALAPDAVVPVGSAATTYDVTVNSVSGNGVLRVDVNAGGSAIEDAAGNDFTTGSTTGQTYTIDQTAPATVSINRQSPAAESTTAASVTFRIIFSEKVTGVNAADFTATPVDGNVAGTLASNAVVAVGTEGTTYDVTVSSLTGAGTLRLDVNASNTGITDEATNTISGGFTIGQTYSVDRTSVPAVVSISRQSPTTESTTATTVTYRVTFSRKVTGVNSADFAVTAVSGNVAGTVSSSNGVTPVGSNGDMYDVRVSSITGSGTLRLDLKGSGTGIVDENNNPISGGFTTGETYIITIPPTPTGFSSTTTLSSISLTTHTGEKPQGKLWKYAGKWWAALDANDGTAIYRLDGTNWTRTLELNSSGHADTWVVGNVTHILFVDGSSGELISVEYNPAAGNYKLWSQRSSVVDINFGSSTETATITVDGTGRMWVATDGSNKVSVQWSDAPYSSWSSPITLATGTTADDISAIVAFPGKIGVLWSNQNTKRFGFKTHADGTNPATWSADEAPAAQGAQNVGAGLGDDHMNIVAASDGTLYCAVKTGYDKSGYPKLALLVRRPAGTWDNLYTVTTLTSSGGGTRAIAVLNEAQGKLKIVYTSVEDGGDILYKEALTSNLTKFSNEFTLFKGTYNNVTSTHQTYNPDVVLMAANSSKKTVSVLGVDGASSGARMMATQPAFEQRALEKEITETGTGTAVVFPTPVKKGTAVTVQNKAGELTQAVVFDAHGRLVRASRFTGSLSIDTYGLPAGIYHLRLTGEGTVKTQKIIVTD